MAALGPRSLGFAYDISEATDQRRETGGGDEGSASNSGFSLEKVRLLGAFFFGGACGEPVNARRNPIETSGRCVLCPLRGLAVHSVTP
jgi:hypothetical protein